MRRRLLLVLALLPCLATVVCFPDLPDPGLVDNLRVLAVRADPATAVMDSWPLPTVTVTALVVDPADEDLSGATHRWWLDLDDSIEGVDMLQAMIPPEPHGPSIVIDPNLMMATADDDDDDQGPLLWVLPLRYRVETADDYREAIKLVYFLTPEATGDDDDSAADDDDTVDDDDDSAADDDDSATDDDDSSAGDDDDSAAGDDDDSAMGDDDDSAMGDDDDSSAVRSAEDNGDEEYPEGYNANPTLLSLTVDGDRTYTAEAGDLPDLAGALDLGAVDPNTGVTLTIEVDDDKELDNVYADLFWTGGCPGLPEPSGPGGGDVSELDECPSGASTWGYGGSAILDDGDPPREFGWFPLSDTGPTHLWLILSDYEGGVTWIELSAS